MYTKRQARAIREEFWTSFGQYMRPVAGANGEAVNWLNYKTGIKHIFFRMDADNKSASVAIELHHPDPAIRNDYFEKFGRLKAILFDETHEEWNWQLKVTDEHGKWYSRIGITINGISLFDKNDWPAIISFLKPRIIALDSFWNLVKDSFE